MRYGLAVWAVGLVVSLPVRHAIAADVYSIPDADLSMPPVFVVYGDMRFTTPTETTAAAPGPRRALVEKVASEHPDALFLTGDIPWHGGDPDDYQEYSEETATWHKQHLRVYPVLGNHEFSECAEPGVWRTGGTLSRNFRVVAGTPWHWGREFVCSRSTATLHCFPAVSSGNGWRSR